MDSKTYEQYTLTGEVVGDAAPWLEPEIQITAELLDGQVVGIQLPAAMEYTIVDTSPVMKTATKTASAKPAKLSNGLTIQVPEFLDTGVRVRVDPRTGTYLERAK
jgi:elongation factor P